MTFKTAERRNNTAERLLLNHPPIRNQVWLTTLKEVTTDPLGSIWVKPGDYLKVTAGSVCNAFASLQAGNSWGMYGSPSVCDRTNQCGL
jgi:hypothetical protein